jgi:hypothetical protein
MRRLPALALLAGMGIWGLASIPSEDAKYKVSLSHAARSSAMPLPKLPIVAHRGQNVVVSNADSHEFALARNALGAARTLK